MEQDQDKRDEDAALGHDPFADMTWERESPLVDEPEAAPKVDISEAAALADELADDMDDLEKMLFDDEPELSLVDELSADEPDDLESMLFSDEMLFDDEMPPVLETEQVDDAPDEPISEPFIAPPAPIAPPVAEELKAALSVDEMDNLEEVEETAVFDDTTSDLESDLIVEADEEPAIDIDALLQKIDSEIESINESVHHEEDDAPLELLDLDVDLEEETAVFDETEPEPEESRYLDDLIANIDNQIDALYGTEDSIDLSSEQTHIPGQEEQHVIFHLADTEYTVPIGNVTEIGRPLPTTTVPNVPGWLLGVANLRGDIVSMVDLRGFLGLPPAHFEQDGRMIITQSTDEEVTAGLLVDRVSGIRFLAVEGITAPTAAIEDQVAPYLRGVYEDSGRLLVVLNLDKLLLSSEMQQFETM